MKIGFTRLAPLMFDANDPGGAPAAPAAPSPAAPGGTPSAPAPGAPAVGTPAAPAAQPQAPAGFTYKEDRSNWVPSHVVRQRTEELERLRREHYVAQQRVAALSGVTPPPAPRDPEHDVLRNQLYMIAPELKELADMRDKIKEFTGLDFKDLTGSIQSIKQAQKQAWDAQGNQTLRTLTDKIKTAYGGAELPPKQLRRIANAFVVEIQEDDEMRARYESGDPTLIDEFITDFTGGVLDPYRRSTAAAAAPRFAATARLPRGGGSSAVVGARPATLKPSDPGFHEAAFKRMSEGG